METDETIRHDSKLQWTMSSVDTHTTPANSKVNQEPHWPKPTETKLNKKAVNNPNRKLQRKSQSSQKINSPFFYFFYLLLPSFKYAFLFFLSSEVQTLSLLALLFSTRVAQFWGTCTVHWFHLLYLICIWFLFIFIFRFPILSCIQYSAFFQSQSHLHIFWVLLYYLK